MRKNSKISVGVFDSGIGGLTVLRELVSALPEVRFYYFGDNSYAPYGNKSEAEIAARAVRAVELFRKLKTDVVVIACNTVTTVCLSALRKVYAMPIVGVEPDLKTAARFCRRVLLLATPRTVGSERVREILAENRGSEVTVFGAKNLAGLIENSLVKGENFSLENELPKGEFDGVVLGCTHYLHVAGQISAHYGCPVFDGRDKVVAEVALAVGEVKIGKSVKLIGNFDPAKKADFFKINRPIFIGKDKNANKKVYNKHMF